MVKPPSPHSAMHCLPGYARALPNAFGAALAMDAQENEPKSLRFLPPLICLASQIQAVPVSAKNIASSDASWLSVAARNSGRMGLILGPLSTECWIRGGNEFVCSI